MLVEAERMGGWAGRAEAGGEDGWGPELPVSQSVVEVARQRLVELEVGHGLGIGRVEARCLVEEEVPLRRAAGRRERGRPVGEVEVQEDGGDDGRVGEEGEDAHGPAAGGTEERQDLVDPG